jgi:multidrug resistance protein MdtO
VSAIAPSFPATRGRSAWLWELLKDELAPYKGRTALVARMVTASTLMMIVGVTFQIPYAAYAALFAFNISRESIEGTASAARGMVFGSALGGAYVLICTALVLGNAMLRFLWVIVTLFLVFYSISALSDYTVSARFGYLNVIIIPLATSQVSAETKIETTLWAVGAISLGSIVAFLLEIVFASFRRTDELTEALTERLNAMEEALRLFGAGGDGAASAGSAVTRLASVGTSRLRLMVQRAGYEPRREQRMAGVVALVGRLVDLVANLAPFASGASQDDRMRLRSVADDIAKIRVAVATGSAPALADASGTSQRASSSPSSLPLLAEIEKTVSLVQDVFSGAESLSIYALLPSAERPRSTPFVPGALSDPKHIKFALRGCLAGSLCFIIYSALFWDGISTSVTTCLLTALTTVGASHQKQFLRFAGALIGGVVIGMGAQVFLLPHIDSIGGFTVLFVAVSVLAAWIATASSRLSYLGVQIAVAFYLINLQEFKIQTSLAVARDRVVGILLGLAMMWLAFDLLWSAPASVEMRKTLASSLRLLAQLAREPVSNDIRVALEQTYALREMINSDFDNVRSLSDGVLFEFGPSRQQDLALRDWFREWQPQLRTLFIMRTTSLKYRLQLPGFELPPAVLAAQQNYDERSAEGLEEMADRIEGVARSARPLPLDSLDVLESSARENFADQAGPEAAYALSFMPLLRRIDHLTMSVGEQVARTFA